MNAERKQALIEVATKRLNQSRKMAEAQKGSVRPRGGIEIDYGINIALMEIALAALTAKPIGYIDPATLKEYRGKRAGGSWSADPKSGEYNQTLPIFTMPPVAAPEQPHHNGMMMLSHKLAAAEAKLAELAKRPPVGEFYEDGPGNWWQIGPHDKVPHVTPLFDRPVPAINLAELVPEEMPDSAYEIMSNKFGSGACMISDDMWEACRAAILRNVELAKALQTDF